MVKKERNVHVGTGAATLTFCRWVFFRRGNSVSRWHLAGRAMPIDGWIQNGGWRKFSVCAWVARWPTITASAGMATAGACHAKKSARAFAERRWKSNDDWTARTRYASAPLSSPAALPGSPATVRQLLLAYGLQDLPNEHRHPKTKSNPNTMCLQITLGGNHGTGHFYPAKNRTFLLCLDTNLVFVLFPLFEASGERGPNDSVGAMFATMKSQKARAAVTAASRFCPIEPETDSGFNPRV
jgi:hypothetical protein